ncbi:MAG: CHAT domain-containing protein [Cyanophyceae cyanobacterium]
MPSSRRQFGINCLQKILFFGTLIFCLWLGHRPVAVWRVGWGQATAQAPAPSQLVQQGADSYQTGNYQKAIENWQQALTIYEQDNHPAQAAIVLENLARTYQQLGQSEPAVDYWERAIAYYRQHQEGQKVGRLMTEQAQVYSAAGQPRKALALLCRVPDEQDLNQSGCVEGSALQIARTHQDRAGEAAALGSLGNAYRLVGNYEQAIECLQAVSGMGEAQRQHPQSAGECTRTFSVKDDDGVNQAYRFSALNNLGNVYTSKAQRFETFGRSAEMRGAHDKATSLKQEATLHRQTAQDYFQQSLELASDRQQQMQVLLNLMQLDRQTQALKRENSANRVQQALNLLDQLPDSRSKAYAAIRLANVSTAERATPNAAQCPQRLLEEVQAEALLKQASSMAHNLGDRRAQSFALGELGHLYECRQDYAQALGYTDRARLVANQNRQAQDSLYLWEWQAGRIFEQQGKEPAALAAYERAITILQEIRDELLGGERELQFDFRDAIEPLYREFARLNLELAESLSPQSQTYQNELNAALGVIDSLKLAELQDYFGDDCILTTFDDQQTAQLLQPDTVVFSSIVLEDRTAIVAHFPTQRKLAWIDVDRATLRAEIENFRSGLLDRSAIFYGDAPNQKPQAKKLYDWIVAPFAADLETAPIKTLVFIQDGMLRSIPMAALYDGEQFLVQKYAIAMTPSLTLTNPRAFSAQDLQLLALGLTDPVEVEGETFPALANVEGEIASVAARFSESKTFLNSNFTQQRLQTELNQTFYPLIHIATHAKFGTVPEDTFLVTGNSQKLTITQLEDDLRYFSTQSNSVELLALTACETGVGDERAVLGLAGIAARAGVKSTLASLWPIQDESTKILVDQFYARLQTGASKAQALQAAQQELIEAQTTGAINDDYVHPYYWAPFILIGNWL